MLRSVLLLSCHLVVLTLLLSGIAQADKQDTQPYQFRGTRTPGFEFGGYVRSTVSGGMILEWSGSTVDVTFVSESCRLRFEYPTHSQYWVKIDDSPYTCHKAEKIIDLSSKLKPTEGNIHRLRIVKKTEPDSGVDLFLGIDIDKDGRVVNESTTRPDRRKILFLGDSITVGLQSPTRGQTDVMSSYAWLIGEKLDADIRIIAKSGVGVHFGWRKKTFLPEWEAVMKGQKQSPLPTHTWQPDLIVVNLGTNDKSKGVGGKDYTAAMKKLLLSVIGEYKTSTVAIMVPWTYGCYPKALAGVVSETRGETKAKIHLIKTDPRTWVPKDGMSDNTHPNLKGHQAAARKLLPAITRIMKWKLKK